MGERELYALPPKEFRREGYIMRMKKAAYGFADAPRRWFISSDKTLKSLGFVPSKVDAATYYLRSKKGLHGILCLHVDDGLCVGDKYFREKMQGYFDKYKTNPDKGDSGTFEYTGAEVCKEDDYHFTMSQHLYAALTEEKKCKSIDPKRFNDKKCDLTEDEKSFLRQITGVLGWPAVITRPDIAAETSMLQTAMAHPKMADIHSGNKLIRRLKATGHKRLNYINVSGTARTALIMFTDAANHNLRDPEGEQTQSQAGWILLEVEIGTNQDGHLIMVDNPKANILAWSSKKIKRTARSSFTAETLAAVDAADALVYAAYMYEEFLGHRIHRFLATDSMNLKDHVQQMNSKVTERRLKVDLYSLKENIQNDELILLWIDGEQNVADGLTKCSTKALKALDHLIDHNRIPATHMSAMTALSDIGEGDSYAACEPQLVPHIQITLHR